MDEVEQRTLIFFWIFAIICIVSNALVVITIIVKTISSRIQTPFIILLLLFHISNIGDVVTVLPNTFNFDGNWCLANESFKFYFGLMNILIVFFVVQAYRIHLFAKNNKVINSTKLRMFVLSIIFFVPMIAFLPYTDRAYTIPDNAWCVLTYDRGGIWVLLVQYLWVIVVLLVNIITNIWISSFILQHTYDRPMIIKFILNVVAYSFIALISWIPRFYELWEPKRSDDDNSTILKFYQFFPITIAGILYVLLFLINRRALLLFARQSNTSDILHFQTNDLLSIIEEGMKNGGRSGENPDGSHSYNSASFLQLFSEYFRFSSKSFNDNMNEHQPPSSNRSTATTEDGDGTNTNNNNYNQNHPQRQSVTGNSINRNSMNRNSMTFLSTFTNSLMVGRNTLSGNNNNLSEENSSNGGAGAGGVGRSSLAEILVEIRRERRQSAQAGLGGSDGVSMNPLNINHRAITAPSPVNHTESNDGESVNDSELSESNISTSQGDSLHESDSKKESR
eukprot:gene7123-7694_t